MNRRSALVGLTLLLAACATANVNPEYRLKADAAEGVITGSVSYSGRYSGYRVYYRRVGGEELGYFEIGTGNALLPIVEKGDFAIRGLRGTVFAAQLPAGEYEMHRWIVSSGASTVTSTVPFSISFTVDSGKLVYLGNFHFTTTSTMGLTVTGARLSHRDAVERDLPVFQKKFPGLAETPMAYAIEKGAERNNVGGSSFARIVIPIYVPVR